jgi:hypothetical protein
MENNASSFSLFASNALHFKPAVTRSRRSLPKMKFGNSIQCCRRISRIGDSTVPESVMDNPVQATNWVKAQLGNRASQVTSDSYVGLFSSQQMVVQNRLSDPPLRQALAKNPVIQSKVSGNKIEAVDLGEISDDGLEELGLAFPAMIVNCESFSFQTPDIRFKLKGLPALANHRPSPISSATRFTRGKTCCWFAIKKRRLFKSKNGCRMSGFNPRC